MRLTEDTIRCMVTITDEQRRERSTELVRSLDKIDHAKDELAEEQASIKAEIKELETRVRELRRVLQSGMEMMDIQCNITYDWSTGKKIYSNPETGEVLHQENISVDEQQEHLLGVEAEGAPLTGEEPAEATE